MANPETDDVALGLGEFAEMLIDTIRMNDKWKPSVPLSHRFVEAMLAFSDPQRSRDDLVRIMFLIGLYAATDYPGWAMAFRKWADGQGMAKPMSGKAAVIMLAIEENGEDTDGE